MIPSLTKHSNSLVKLFIDGEYSFSFYQIPLSFIAKFTNLQELVLNLYCETQIEDFKMLQYVTFSQLKVLKIRHKFPKYELLINFIEINGKNLRECYIGDHTRVSDNSLNLAIAKFCPNLRKLSVGFKDNELETLKIVFNNCQYLECINIWCGNEFLSEKDALEMVWKYSPKNFHKLKLVYQDCLEIRPALLEKEMESFSINWASRIPRKSFFLIAYDIYHVKKHKMQLLNN